VAGIERSKVFDLILAPYEATSITAGSENFLRGGSAGPKRAETEACDFQKYVPDLQEALPLSKEIYPQGGSCDPMEVMTRHFGRATCCTAINRLRIIWPNDARVHEAKGAKRFSSRILWMRVSTWSFSHRAPIVSRRSGRTRQRDGYLASTLAHEISHELGPNISRTATGQKDIREAIGGDFAALEEAKADVVGMFCLKWLADHGRNHQGPAQRRLPLIRRGNFRTIRFGIAEPHGRGEMMEFSTFSNKAR